MKQNDESALGSFLNEGEYAIEDDFLKYGYKIFEIFYLFIINSLLEFWTKKL